MLPGRLRLVLSPNPALLGLPLTSTIIHHSSRRIRSAQFCRFVNWQDTRSISNKLAGSKNTKMPEFRLKDVSSLEMQNGDKVEAQVEGVEGGKVLLVKTGDKVHAMNANCTHYGAPLKNGILTKNGRLTCPWHGACFNVATGDIENAPAPDPLSKFDVTEKDGAVYITGQEASIKAGRRMPTVKCSSQGQEKVVVVGGGSGAFGTIQELRVAGYKGAITLIGNEENLPLDRTKLSKALIPDAQKLLLRSPEWYREASVDLISDSATSVDFSQKNVLTKGGLTIPYTKLVLATGGTPKRLPLPGFKELKNIFVLRHIGDVRDILAAVGDENGKKIAVVGSSFIGMEVGNALSKQNSVSIIGMEKRPLERIMGADVGKIFQSTLEKNGVQFYMAAAVESAVPSSSDSQTVGAVKLKDGTTVEADVVVLGVGVGPATEYLRDNSSIKLEKDGSVAVNEKFQAKGMDDVYAIGDIATYPYYGPDGNGTNVRIEHWNVAQNAGRSVGRTIANAPPSLSSSSSSSSTPDNHFIPIFWSALGSQLRYCGHTPNGWDDMLLTGEDPDNGKFVAYFFHGETVVAVATMMMDPIMTKCSELMLQGKMPPKQQLVQDKVDILAVEC